MEDVGVPRGRVPELLVEIQAAADRHGVRVATFGHAGDGNLHPNFIFDHDDPRAPELTHLVRDEIFAAALRMGGTVTAEHGRLTVPPPAVLALLSAARAPVAAHPVARELCTPTGAALLVTLADGYGPMPACTPVTVGIGAGTADPPGHANIVRVVVGQSSAPTPTWVSTDLVTLETTVDDLDPRLWPDVLAALRKAGGADAWCAPVTAHKGRPGMLLTVLVAPDRVDGVCAAIFAHTSTLGVRLHPVERRSLHRDSVSVQHDGGIVHVKRGYLDGAVVTVQPEYEDVKAAAECTGRPLRQILDEVRSAAIPSVIAGPARS